MDVFRTILPIEPSSRKLSHQHKIMSLGSCFAENVGKRLAGHKFDIQINPFGILYNPLSIATGLGFLKSDYKFTEQRLFHHQGLWHSFFHHGRFSHSSPKICLDNINTELQAGSTRLKELDYLILTFGTAHAFYLKRKEKVIVANCHKLPAKEFERKLLTKEQIVNVFSTYLKSLKEQNPNLQVILSVSPVRYLRDGLVNSNRSKATLLMAVHELADQFPFVSYFPAYELVTDELRDYRFFKDDMAHPSDLAIEYVWKRFQETYFDEATRGLNKKLHQLRRSVAHRPLHPESEAHQKFIKSQLLNIQRLENQYSFLDLSMEKQHFLSP